MDKYEELERRVQKLEEGRSKMDIPESMVKEYGEIGRQMRWFDVSVDEMSPDELIAFLGFALKHPWNVGMREEI